MKLSIKRVRELIHEEVLRGVPDFVLRQAANKFVGEIRKHIMAYVSHLSSDSSPADRVNRIESMNSVLQALEVELHDLIEERLFDYLRQV